MGMIDHGKVALTFTGAAWDATTVYDRLTVVNSGLSKYLSLQPDNVGHALTDGEWWQLWIDGSDLEDAIEDANIAAEAAEDASDRFEELLTDAILYTPVIGTVQTLPVGEAARIEVTNDSVAKTSTLDFYIAAVTPEVEYVAVDTYGDLPATGSVGTIYRVANWDGTQVDPSAYAEYSWTDSQYKLLSVKQPGIDNTPTAGSNNLVKSGGVFNNIGAFDISELNATENPHTLAVYADLSAALAALPADYRKGGMSVKFIQGTEQTSDNKYVQYFLTKDEWSASEADWEMMNLEEEVSQLGQKVSGKSILSYSGSQAFIILPEAISQETLVHIKMNGNVGDIARINFMANDLTSLLNISDLDFRDCVLPIPANTARVGIYEKTGKTLNINVTITEIGLEQALELSERENGLVIDSLGWTAQVCSFYNAVKCLRYYAPNNFDVPYIRIFGFYTNKIQLTVSYDKSTNIDFTTPASERPTGVKTHILTNSDKQIIITVNWDVLSTAVSDSQYRLGIRINDYSCAIVPTINEKIGAFNLSRIDTETEQVGEGLGASDFNVEQIYCPHKAITKDGYLSEIGFYAGADCTLSVYIGELDQRYLFIPRSSHAFSCVSGANVLNVESQKIPVYAGEYIAFIPNAGGVKYNSSEVGDPLSENSFLYTANGSTNLFQLQVYGVQKIFRINFYAKTTTDVFIRQTLETLKLQAQISTMGESVGSLSSSIGIVNDDQENKYRLKVVNGVVVPVRLNFKNVLCVGNSFTVHPTTTDTGAAFVTAYWWGHWAMAASSPNVAWTKLLENSLRVNQNDAVVTPIFGRPYETGTYNLTDDDAFVYWDNGTRKSLKANLASFSGVDNIIFFLGDNYSGNDWETRFSAMCEQFATWFPSASIYCVGAVISASVASAIQNVASAKGYPFIDVLSIKTQPLRNREGNFVLGDDNALHQINYSAVGNHFGDYGQFKLNERIATALGVTPVAVAYAVTLESQLLSLLQFNYLEDSIVSIFADASVNTISVVDSSNNAITAISHSTDYGKIFTFTMPANDVSVSVAS